MRIAQILPELNVGGVETGTVDLAKALKAMGHIPFVISNGGDLVNELVKVGITHIKLPVHKKSIKSLWLIPEIQQLIERERIDIIHARSRVPAWLTYLAVRRTSCDFVTTCHGYYSKHFFSRVMGWGKRVIVISHAIGRRMIDDFKVSPGRITLIHRGVDLNQFKFDPHKYDKKPKGPFRVINVGRISPVKGHDDFIRGIHLLSKRLPNIEAIIVGGAEGEKTPYLDHLKLMVERLGLASHVKFLGVRRDVPSLIQQADLLVLSSKIPEGMGRVLIEAGALGTCVLASRIGGILDVVDDGENGLLFSPENFEEMAMLMEQLLRDRELSKRLAHNLERKVVRDFSLETMVEKTCQVYEEVKQQKKILITKLGALGDLILAIPSFRMIRKRFPKAHITLLTDPKLIPAVDRCPYLDDIIAFDRKKNKFAFRFILKVGKWVRERSFDLCIDLHHTWRTYVLAVLGQIPKRYGYRRGWGSLLLTHSVALPRERMAPVEHQFQVLRRAGVNQFDDQMELWTDPEADQTILKRLRLAGVEEGNQLVGFILGASERWSTKRWPIEYFVELSNQLKRFEHLKIVLIGSGPQDELLGRHFSSDAFGHVINQIGKTDLTELMSLIKQLDVIVSGDTAALHLASAVQTKVVALFGPTDPARHMPPGDGHISIVKRIACQPCYKGECKNPVKLECLREIEVDEVLEAVVRQLESSVRTSLPVRL